MPESLLEPRASVRLMKEYHPPLSGRDGLRLDFNENTVGCSPRVIGAIREISAEMLTVYPERESVERNVAQYFQRHGFAMEPGNVLLTNGVDEAIHLVCEAYLEPSDEVLIVVPTFSMYEIYAMATGARVKAIPAGQDFSFPTAAVLDAITARTKLVAVATPNNPTGAIAAPSDLLKIARECPRAAMLVDEAYIHFGGESVLSALEEIENIFVMRTFSKVYGLAALRIGVLLGSAGQLGYVRKVSSPYNLNSVALRCLPVALEDEQYVRAYVTQIIVERKRLELELQARAVPFWPSQANFLLTNIGKRHGEFVQSMRKRGILVRDRSADPGCWGCVRITIGSAAQMDRAISALDETLDEIGWHPDRGETVAAERATR